MASQATPPRSCWGLFEIALGPAMPIGITALETRDYDPRRWWQSSSGVRATLDEVIAYAYARLLFREAPRGLPEPIPPAR